MVHSGGLFSIIYIMDNTIKPEDFKPIKAKRLAKPKTTIEDLSKESEPKEKGILKTLKDFLFGWILTKKSSQENLFQYLFRQILLVDSKGVPSVTNTMTWLSIAMTYFWFKYETQIALSPVTTTTENGSMTHLKGYNDYVYGILILIISAVLAMYYKRDRRKSGEEENQAGSIISAAKDFITSKLK